ncbi:MAG: low molecular weight protein-tyrosine-phosphatase [Candidatus Promineifilaceae bacterium]
MPIKVLFVCLGNICRSPMAEGVFQSLVKESGLEDKFIVDSAGTSSWHVGEKAHHGTRRVLAAHGVAYSGRSRQISARDKSDSWDYIVAMDQSNLREIRRNLGDHPELHLLLDFASHSGLRDVPDPYYNGKFEDVYALVEEGSKGLLAHIRRENGL